MTNIILCGGSGTRLWPLSRTLMPKQFVKLFNGESLFQKTVERNQKVCNAQFIVSNAEQYFLAVDQIEEHNNDHSKLNIKHSTFLLEPVGRNTAPAIALACFALDAEEIVLVTPSDHLIKNEKAYFEAVEKAKALAQADNLVTFGITPQYPETGFGYIQAEPENDELGIMNVKLFHEKPDLETAQKYLEQNSTFNLKHLTLFLWNSGMFMFKAGVFLEELKKYSPDIYEACARAFEKRKVDNATVRIQHSHMEAIPSESIDYAVMEKSSRVKVIAANIDWSDVGSFDALYKELPKDGNGNTQSDKHIAIDSRNNLIYTGEKYIATVDVEDMIIVDTGDALLVSKKGSSQKVKKVVAEIRKHTDLHNIHLTGYRPWGSYTILEEFDGYKIKRIEVNPGGRLSLQRHRHRNEHWVVIKGTATVTVNDKIFTLEQNESTYIKAGDIHRLENKTEEPLLIVEAQVGSYTGEDDIERLEDDYKRS